MKRIRLSRVAVSDTPSMAFVMTLLERDSFQVRFVFVKELADPEVVGARVKMFRFFQPRVARALAADQAALEALRPVVDWIAAPFLSSTWMLLPLTERPDMSRSPLQTLDWAVMKVPR